MNEYRFGLLVNVVFCVATLSAFVYCYFVEGVFLLVPQLTYSGVQEFVRWFG